MHEIASLATYNLKNVVPNCSSKTCGKPCSWTISTPSTVFLIPNLSYSSLNRKSKIKTAELSKSLDKYLGMYMYQSHSFKNNQSWSRTKHPKHIYKILKLKKNFQILKFCVSTTSASCWCNDGPSKKNFNFEGQSIKIVVSLLFFCEIF